MSVTLLDRLKGCQKALEEMRHERDALAAALRAVTHEYQPTTFGAWRDNEPETYNATVELCGKCRRERNIPRHATPEVVLTAGGAA